MNVDKLLDYARIALYGVFTVIFFILIQRWQEEHPKNVEAQTTLTQPAAGTTSLHAVPNSQSATPTASTVPTASVAKEVESIPTKMGKLVTVTTDLMQIEIDTLGGDVVSSKLIKYPESLHSSTPFLLLNNDAKTRYIAESGLLSKRGPETEAGQALYTTTDTSYNLSPNDKQLIVNLMWQKDGVKVIKSFTFERGSYEVKVAYNLDNQSNAIWNGNLYTQLLRTNSPPPAANGLMNLATYFGAAVSTPDKPFDKIAFKKMQEKPVDLVKVNNGWVAMIQHYFISAWVPPKMAVSRYFSNVTKDGLYTIGMIGQDLEAAPGTKIETEAKLYMGPAIASLLEKTAPGLKLTIDYGWFWFISDIIFWMMQAIYDVIGNWGWSIVLVTVVIKLLFYKLSAKSYRSMSMLKKLQPKIEGIRERYKDDKARITKETLSLYRQEKVNPMSGCLPILIQIPVFIALYWVLVESVQLRQAPFIFWIHDLSQHDQFYVLPILMGLSMFMQQRLNPPPPDPMQAKVMMFMPLIFTFLFANFPAGLLLYWFVNNTLSFLQQWYIMHGIQKGTHVIKA